MSDSQHRTRPSAYTQRQEPYAGGPRTRRNAAMNEQPPNTHNQNNHQKRKKKKPKKKITKILLIVLVLIIFAIIGAGLGTVFGILQGTEMLNTSDVMPQSYTSIIYDDQGNEVDKLHGNENREYVNLSEIPLHMQQAVIAIEDERFYEHGGIDVRGIFRAMVHNIKNFEFSQGASTITQQLIKNEVLSREKSITRKVKEQYLAINLEDSLEDQLGSKKAAKDYILELYLNTIALSHGLNGVESASQYYFGKHVSDLTLAESASIASITNNPSIYAPDTKPENNKKRQTLVLDKMLELEFITKSEYDTALAEDIYSNLICNTTQEETGVANHNYFVEAMIDQLAKDLTKLGYTSAQAYKMIYNNGLQIHTTMNVNMQNILDNTFVDDSMFPPSDGVLDVTYLISVLDTTNPDESTNQSHYERKTTVGSEAEVNAFVQSVKDELLDDTHTLVLDKVTISKSLQSAMVIMNQQNGHIKAVVGGRGQKPGDSVFNRATQGLRQQGSAMKPLASYAPAIDTGILMPGSVIIDEPVTYGSWSPQNWQRRFFGPLTVREGIRDSMNILAVKTFMMVGAETSYEYMKKLGLEHITEEDKAATTALGGLTQGVSVLEMTGAYATIANGGTYYEPLYYSVVYDHDGNVLLDNRNKVGTRVLKETTAYLLTDMMKDVITGGTGGAARLSGMTVAGKTGTTNDNVDLTFYGYTPYYTAGIWMGYDTSKQMNIPGSAHLKIWRHVMNQIHENLPNKDFTKPNGIVGMTVCAVTGNTATELCGQDYYGYTTRSDIAASDFKGGGKVCDAHKSFVVCKESGKLAGENCPETDKMTVVLAVDGTKVLSKPGSISSGRMDIDISQTCDISHTSEKTDTTETDETNTPDETDTDGTQNENTSGDTPQHNQPETPVTPQTPQTPPDTTIPAEPANPIPPSDENFGIQ